MVLSARSRIALLVVGAGILSAACNKRPAPFQERDRSVRSDRTAPVDPPNSFPEWAYDAPEYAKPAAELPPEPRMREKDPLHYFTNKTMVMIRRPSGYKSAEIPRVAIWWTDSNGFEWHKGGFFGRDQTYFPLQVEEDGDYGIRFVGPGQPAALKSLPMPQRVYHVDTAPPEVEIVISPKQTWYHVGQAVTISWRASDHHLIAEPVRIGVLTDFAADEGVSIELQRSLGDDGDFTYSIAESMLGNTIRFRADALDRAGNLGFAFSHALQIVERSTVAGIAVDAEDNSGAEPAGTGEIETKRSSTHIQLLAEAPTDPVSSGVPEASGDADIEAAPPSKQIESVVLSDEVRSEDDAEAPVTEGAEPTYRQRLAAWSDPARTAARTAGTQALAWVADRLRLTARRTDTGTSGTADTVVGRVADAAPSEQEPAETEQLDVAMSTPRSAEAGPPDEAAPPSPDWIDQDRNADPVAGPEKAPVENPASLPEPADTAAANADDPAWVGADESAAAAACDPDGFDELPETLAGGDSRVALGSRSYDPTHGNGLWAPLPATIEPVQAGLGDVAAHPWRTLRVARRADDSVIWRLPRPRFGDALYRLFEGRFFAENGPARPVGEPLEAKPVMVGEPDMMNRGTGPAGVP